MLVWLYRSLGIVARINQTTSRIRLKGVPLNWIALFWMAACIVWQGTECINSLVHRPLPNQVAISDLRGRSFDYVTLQGYLFPESKFRLGGAQYIPLIEEDSRRAILVLANDKHGDDAESRFSTVTGRLQPLDPEQQMKLSRADLGRDIYLETTVSLAEGTLPNTAWSHGAIAGGVSLLLAAFIGTLTKHGVIFKVSKKPLKYQAVPSPSESKIDLHISACLTLHQSLNDATCQQRFLDVPGTVSTTDRGEMVLMAHVDVSSREGFAVTDWKVGWWQSAIASKSIHDLEAGQLYLGGRSRSAIRFRYCEPTGELKQTVLSFATPLQRQYAFNHLIHSFRSA